MLANLRTRGWPTPSEAKESAWWNGRSGPAMRFPDRTSSWLWPTPAPDYTRVTVESGEPLRHRLILLRNPERLALDLEDVDFPSVQQAFAGKVSPIDPYIGNLRVGRFKPGVVRVVLDLKSEVKPQIFTLAPIGDYG